MSSALATAGAAAVQVLANAAQGILGIYWNDSRLSVFGLFIFIVMSLLLSYILICAACAVWYRDWTFFRLTDSMEQTRVFGRSADGTWTVMQWMVVTTGANYLAAITGWYSTPPSRTPPIIQALFQSVPIVTAIPCSRYLLGDRKRYLTWRPLTAIACLFASIIMSLIPSVVDGSGFSGVSGLSTLGWCLVCLGAQIPTGAAFTCQQGYLIRAGAATPGVSRHHRIKVMLRMLLFNQIFILLIALALFGIDLLPWFGSSASLADFSHGVLYSFECSLLGPSGVVHVVAGTTATTCSPNTPLYAAGFIVAYVMMLLAVTTLNVESAVFNTVCYVLNTMASAVFWLIPGTNPGSTAATPPLWSVIIALLFSVVGVALFKAWEMQQPLTEEFELLKHALPDMHPSESKSVSKGGLQELLMPGTHPHPYMSLNA